MPTLQSWVRIVLSCHIQERNARFLPTRHSTKRSGTFTNDVDGMAYLLIFHESLWMGDKLDHTLVNPNQLRAYGVSIKDNPFDAKPLSITTDDASVELYSEGTIICGDTRTPTESELSQLPRLILTSPHDWDPHNICFPSCSGQLSESASIESSHLILAVDTLLQHTTYDPIMVASLMSSHVQITEMTMPSTLQDIPSAQTFQSKERHSSITPSDLSERWYIGLGQATQTLKVTIQRLMRSTILPLARRYRADRMFIRPCIRSTIYTDTMNGRYKSLDGNKHAQIFANESFFAIAYPMQHKTSVGQALKQFISDFGIPDKLVCDGAAEQVGKRTEFQSTVQRHAIDLHVTEPHRHNQSKVEGVIQEIRKQWFCIMLKKKVPRRLWDYGIKWVCEVIQRTASTSGDLSRRTALEQLTGETPEISEYLDFTFYDWCWYNDNAGLGETKLGRWLGISHRIGSLMSYWVLTQKGNVISRTTVSRVTNLEMQIDSTKSHLQEFDTAITDRLNDEAHSIIEGGKSQPYDWSDPPFDEDIGFVEEFHSVVSNSEIKEANEEFTPDTYDDRYLNMELAIPRGDNPNPQYAKVTKRLRYADGIPIGMANENPILDSRMYEVEYQDGTKASLEANYIAENLFAQVDQEGNRHVLLDEIIDYRVNGREVKLQDAFITTGTGTRRRRETTIGWELLAQWKDRSTNWVSLKDPKEAYPVQTAEYAVAAKIAMEPAFAWWVLYTLKKRN